MKKILQLLPFFVFITFSNLLIAQTIWDGPNMTFAKEAFANPTLEENQDRITENVWITRANTQGLFNAKTETSYNGENSPADTEWAKGTTANIESLSFSSWVNAVAANPPDNLNENFVLHLISDDIYIDIMFTQWGQGGNAGGFFAYTRSTDPSTSLENLANAHVLSLSPNPAVDFIAIKGDLVSKDYKIVEAATGKLIKKGTVDHSQQIDIKELENGNYFLVCENGKVVMKFVKMGL